MHSPPLRHARRAAFCMAAAATVAAGLSSTTSFAGGRIVGGGPASAGEYPYFTALLFADAPGQPFERLQCGGALIDPQTVLTAAHCVDGVDADQFEVVLGRVDLNDESTGEVIAVTEIQSHPDFVRVEEGDDVALLRLETPSDAPTIALAGPDEASLVEPFDRSTVIGHGATSTSGPGSPRLLEVDVEIQDDEYMESQYAAFGGPYDAATMVGAGPRAGGQDSCQGDSGGPLVVFGDDGPRVIGVVSWGGTSQNPGCAIPDLPGIYAEVYQGPLRDWVFANV
jgi:secreted trypsin-like serine protease